MLGIGVCFHLLEGEITLLAGTLFPLLRHFPRQHHGVNIIAILRLLIVHGHYLGFVLPQITTFAAKHRGSGPRTLRTVLAARIQDASNRLRVIFALASGRYLNRLELHSIIDFAEIFVISHVNLALFGRRNNRRFMLLGEGIPVAIRPLSLSPAHAYGVI